MERVCEARLEVGCAEEVWMDILDFFFMFFVDFFEFGIMFMLFI